MRRKGFSMIELLFVMTIMGSIASMAAPSYFGQLKADMRIALKSNLLNNYKLTKNIMDQGYYAPIIDFTSASGNKIYSTDIDGSTYNYALKYTNIHFVEVKIYDKTTSDYTGAGLILSNEQFPDCYVYNNINDSEPYFSTSCTADDLNWNYQN